MQFFKNKFHILVLYMLLTLSICAQAQDVQTQSSDEATQTTSQPAEQQPLIFSVQVAALSDESATINLQRELVAIGFPAFVESATTDSGVLYRLRVGAFGNREAAERYALELTERMPELKPIPVTTNMVLSGIAPLLPKVIARYPYTPITTEFKVVKWKDIFAVRFQDSYNGKPLEAEYRIIEPSLIDKPFNAWRATPSNEGTANEGNNDVRSTWVLRVASLPLAAKGVTGEQRQAAVNASVAQIAKAMRINEGDVVKYIQPNAQGGTPSIIIAERYYPATGQTESFNALGDVDTANAALPQGPALTWFSGNIPTTMPQDIGEVLIDPRTILGLNDSLTMLPDPADLPLVSQNWRAASEDNFTRIYLNDGTSWRALVGFPLWAYHDFLLVYVGDELVLYQFTN